MPKILEQLKAMRTSLNAMENLVNRLDGISKDAVGLRDDLLDWVMRYKDQLAAVPGCMDALTSFTNRLLVIREREVAAYNDWLEVLKTQTPRMR